MRNKLWAVKFTYTVLLSLVLALGLGIWILGPEPMRVNFERLRLGMTAEEVDTIMGPPTEEKDAVNLSPLPGMTPEYYADFKEWQAGIGFIRKWHGKGGNIYCGHFNNAGRLTYTAYGNPNDD